MRYARHCISSVVVGNMIYLFAGGNSRIEVFDTDSMVYNKVRFYNMEYGDTIFGVASLYEDRIYLVTNNYIQVYDTNLNLLQYRQLKIPSDHWTNCNLAYYNNKIYYHNFMNISIEFIDISLPEYPTHITTESAYLYKLYQKSKEIHQIDINNSTIQVMIIDIHRKFKDTSLCLLPSGSIFIAGFNSPTSNVSYLYNPFTKTVQKMPDLKIARGFIGLVYHRDFIYAFGGQNRDLINLRNAEKLSLRKRAWKEIGEMIVPRSLPQCLPVENRVYILGGGDRSIEYYDIYTQEYTICKISLVDIDIVAGLVEDRIYCIGDTAYQIFNKEFEEIEREEKWFDLELTQSGGNIVVDEKKVYYFNQCSEELEVFDTRNCIKAILTLKVY